MDNIRLQNEFVEETKIPLYNENDEFDIEYVWWLENKIEELELRQQGDRQ